MSLEGQHFGEFEILECLGQGGMGAVYKARQISLGRFVALKTLQAALARDAEYIARFQQEARAAAVLSHPNLVQVHSAGENDGMHWFAMEYVEGESARVRLKRKGRLSPREAVAIAVHVATALEYGWRKAALIHRDIKPDNIFLSNSGEVKLGDLGLAKTGGQTQGLTMAGQSMGTPHYISPEQVQSMKDVDFRSDIYSLGCTLYHLLSGQPPFDGTSAVSIMARHVREPVPDLRLVWPECPDELAAVVEKMVEKEPVHRQQNYPELIAELRQVYELLKSRNVPDAPPAKQSPPPEPGATPGERIQAVGEWLAEPSQESALPFFTALGVGIVLLIAAGIFFWLWRTSRPSPSDATKDAPYVNTLGMKFVPVPITSPPSPGQPVATAAASSVLFDIWDTRVKDYEVFAKETKRAVLKADIPQEQTHPAVNVSWEDAQAFCQWLTDKELAVGRLPTGWRYRLPSDHEWSCAVGLGSREDPTKMPSENNGRITDAFPWGTQWPPPDKVGNYASEELRALQATGKFTNVADVIRGYHDGYATTSPVGSYAANPFGLFDMGGNVWQWCEDRFDKDREDRVLRGASWNDYDRRGLLSSCRIHNAPGFRYGDGFRCVLAASAH